MIGKHHDVNTATDAHHSFSSVTRPLIGQVPALHNEVKLDAMAVNRRLESQSTMVGVNKHTIHSNAHAQTARTVNMWEQIN